MQAGVHLQLLVGAVGMERKMNSLVQERLYPYKWDSQLSFHPPFIKLQVSLPHRFLRVRAASFYLV